MSRPDAGIPVEQRRAVAMAAAEACIRHEPVEDWQRYRLLQAHAALVAVRAILTAATSEQRREAFAQLGQIRTAGAELLRTLSRYQLTGDVFATVHQQAVGVVGAAVWAKAVAATLGRPIGSPNAAGALVEAGWPLVAAIDASAGIEEVQGARVT